MIILFGVFSTHLAAGSIASFPAEYTKWILVKESFIPGKDVELPEDTALILQETVRTYNWINKGQGTKFNIYVPENKLGAYSAHGPYEDGPTAVGIFEGSDIIFVIEHLIGDPVYGTYDREGNDISTHHPSFNIDVCIRCHTENSAVCGNGTCARPVIDVFDAVQ